MPVLNGVEQHNVPSIGVFQKIVQDAHNASTAKAVQEEQKQIAGLTGKEKEFQEATGINPYADVASREKYGDWRLSEISANTAREWTAMREDSQYQRLVEDLRKAGINPWILQNTGGSPVSSSSQGVNYQGSEMTSAKASTQSSATNVVGRLLMVSAMILMKALI